MLKTETTPLVQSQTPTSGSKSKLIKFGAVAAVVVGGIVVYFTTRPSAASTPSVGTDSMTASFCDPNVKHEFGYIQLPHKVNDHYFYSFFESRNNPATDPLVVWLEGGPGSSSTWAMFNINGPCSINNDLNGTTINPYSWTNNASVLWLDQPTGVGFSYGDVGDDDSNEVDVGCNFYAFMQGWLTKHPHFQSNPFFITGQSYGGHYVPATANYIVRQQTAQRDANTTIHINLQGIAIGNGLTDTVTQMPFSVNMAVANSYNVSLVTSAELQQMQVDAKTLESLLSQCQQPNETKACLQSVEYWDERIMSPMVTNPTRNIYDLRDPCSPNCSDYGMNKTNDFLNKVWVQRLMGVNKGFVWSNDTVHNEFGVDFAKSTAHFVPEILAAGVRVLLYVGDADLICDWKGNDAWAKKLEWGGKATYNAAAVVPLQVDGKEAGQVRSGRGLSFARVYGAGHCAPADQPYVSLALLNRFFQNLPLEN
ncbi:Aste57867_10945 [Aphanomyces stellatus]|uniref:Aste57867_10945 protein n=1 Tax=Aphanomyces stellatus TaxID=120398 RepID=A0A485KST9_9STRA|nr:hypothetical protein As57867_010905 [Aphanomyces stellatus]VFT87813.1 Aste57867_10945 [Aphanomyces stellatus]